MSNPAVRFAALAVALVVLLVGFAEGCGTQVTNVFSNVMAPGDSTPSP